MEKGQPQAEPESGLIFMTQPYGLRSTHSLHATCVTHIPSLWAVCTWESVCLNV